jgi:hypothetical protein
MKVIDPIDPSDRHYLNTLLEQLAPPSAYENSRTSPPQPDIPDLDSHSTLPPISHKINLDPCDLSDTRKQLIRNLIDQYSDTFITPDNPPQKTTAYTHTLNVKPNTGPCVGRYIRTPPKLLAIMHAIIKDYLQKGILEESHSPYSASAMILRKPKFQDSTNFDNPDEFRLVCDMRLINQHIISSFHPTERIPDILHDLAKNKPKYITVADLGMAYYQVPLVPESRKYTAFHIG